MSRVRIEVIRPNVFRLIEPFEAECGITVPKDFVTDGISMPRMFYWYATPTGRGFRASLVHDYLLVTGRGWDYANRMFSQQLIMDRVSFPRRMIYMTGVKLWAGLKSIGK